MCKKLYILFSELYGQNPLTESERILLRLNQEILKVDMDTDERNKRGHWMAFQEQKNMHVNLKMVVAISGKLVLKITKKRKNHLTDIYYGTKSGFKILDMMPGSKDTRKKVP